MPRRTDISALKSIGTVAHVPAPLVPAALRPGDEPVVVGVAADPYPIDGAALAPPDGALAPPDSDGMDVLEPLHGLEMEPRVPGVGFPTPERLGRETLNIDRQGIEAFPELLRRRRVHFRFGNSSGNTSPASISASARATMASSTGRVWANFFAQRASSAISSRMIAPMASWSPGGSLRALAMALSKSFDITRKIPHRPLKREPAHA